MKKSRAEILYDSLIQELRDSGELYLLEGEYHVKGKKGRSICVKPSRIKFYDGRSKFQNKTLENISYLLSPFVITFIKDIPYEFRILYIQRLLQVSKRTAFEYFKAIRGMGGLIK
jgi:hypothetical protein